MRQRRRRLVGSCLALALLSACTADAEPVERAESPSASPSPSPSSEPPPSTAPATPVDAGPPVAPAVRLRAAVDLSGDEALADAEPTTAVAAPDGGAYVVLTPPERSRPHLLATVTPDDGVVRTVPMPRLDPLWDAHLLPDGRLLASGQLRGREPGYGFVVVDPVSGEARTSVVIPYEEGTGLAHGRSAVGADGRTVHLLLSTDVRGRRLDLLEAVDVDSGQMAWGRDLFAEVRSVSAYPITLFSTWLFPRPGGGVAVLFDAFPDEGDWGGIPTVLSYDDTLEPAGPPVSLTTLADRAQIQAAAATPEGTVVVSAETPEGQLLLVVPGDGGPPRRALELPGRTYDNVLAVEPGGQWIVLPAARGARAVDLATGGTTPLDLGCPPPPDVRVMAPTDDGGALLLGECDEPEPGTPTLWFTGP